MRVQRSRRVRLTVIAALGGGALIAAVLLLAAGAQRHHGSGAAAADVAPSAHHRPLAPLPVAPNAANSRRCVSRPGACGYPDRRNTGVPAGTHLTPRSGTIDIRTPGQTVSGLALRGAIIVHADNTTIENDDITVNGSQKGCSSPCGGRGIFIAPGVKHTLIQNVTCHGGAPSGINVTEFCIVSNDPSSVINRVRSYWCTTCFIGPATWENSFVNLNGTIPHEHYEDIYYGGGSSSIDIHHNTLLNPPHDQGDVATIFLSVDFGDERNVSITDNLLAGGAYLLYGGGSGTKGSIIGPMIYTGNRVATLFHPKGGFYGVGAYFKEKVTRWSHNYWDNSLKGIPIP